LQKSNQPLSYTRQLRQFDVYYAVSTPTTTTNKRAPTTNSKPHKKEDMKKDFLQGGNRNRELGTLLRNYLNHVVKTTINEATQIISQI